MYTIEDLLEALDSVAQRPPADKNGNRIEIKAPWDRRFFSDVGYKTREGNCLSTGQGAIAIKLIHRYTEQLVLAGFEADSIKTLVHSPVYRKIPYQSTKLPREVRYIGNRKLAFRSKFNPNILADIKKLKTSTRPFVGQRYPFFNKPHQVWIVEVGERNLEKVIEFIRRYKFGFDSGVEQFLTDCTNAKDNKTKIELSEGMIKITLKNDEWMASWLDSIFTVEEQNSV